MRCAFLVHLTQHNRISLLIEYPVQRVNERWQEQPERGDTFFYDGKEYLVYSTGQELVRYENGSIQMLPLLTCYPSRVVITADAKTAEHTKV